MGEWINVKEAWPPIGDHVLGFKCDGSIEEVKMVITRCELRDGWKIEYWSIRGYCQEFVTHWMPLPEPPKEDNHG